MKKTIKKITTAGAVSVMALSALSASAMGFPGMNALSSDEVAKRQTQLFQQQATMIGASLDEVKNAWAEGKDFLTFAKEKGVTEEQLKNKMKSEREAKMKEHIQSLVTSGVITQTQADKRIATLQKQNSDGQVGHHKNKNSKKGFFGGMF